MTHYAPRDGKWIVHEKAALLISLRRRMTADRYEANKLALQVFLCGNFSSGDCLGSQGSSICPVGLTKRGG